jgi:hypothetical protein
MLRPDAREMVNNDEQLLVELIPPYFLAFTSPTVQLHALPQLHAPFLN